MVSYVEEELRCNDPWLAPLGPAVPQTAVDLHVSSLIELPKGTPLYIWTVQWYMSNSPLC